jgi:hypothetical protein
MTNNLATIEKEQQIQQRHQEQMTRDIERTAAQLPSITENIESQQKQLIKYFRRQNRINSQTDKEMKKLRDTQKTHETMIATLQAIVLQIQNTAPPTPLSQQRVRKKQKPRNLNDTSLKEDSDMDSENEPLELHQMHAITTLQNNSIKQLSFIHPPMDESKIDDDLIPWDTFTTDNEDSEVNQSEIATQEQLSYIDNLGETDPGEDT